MLFPNQIYSLLSRPQPFVYCTVGTHSSACIWEIECIKLWEKLFYLEKFISLKIKNNFQLGKFSKDCADTDYKVLANKLKIYDFKKRKLTKLFITKAQYPTYFYALLVSVDKITKLVCYYWEIKANIVFFFFFFFLFFFFLKIYQTCRIIFAH
jgi:hypothetical protein